MLSYVVVFVFYLYGMPIVINAEQQAAALKTASSDLAFLFDRKLVDEETQAKFYHLGVTTVELFAVLVKDQAELEKVLGEDFGIDVMAFLAAPQGRHKVEFVVAHCREDVTWLRVAVEHRAPGDSAPLLLDEKCGEQADVGGGPHG